MSDDKLEKFRDLRFADFQRMASDESLKPFEKIGFPSSFREGFDHLIFQDIARKVPQLHAPQTKIMDIGCGCGTLTQIVIDNARLLNQQLILVDAGAVLDQLPNENFLIKIPGRFPEEMESKIAGIEPEIIICYSVFHYIFIEGNPFAFIEKALSLLSPGGMFLLGDIPNISKRNRFLSTPQGERFHKKVMNTDDSPMVKPFELSEGKIDDGFISGILNRYRNFGVETYLLPQSSELPLSNSREDILFIKY